MTVCGAAFIGLATLAQAQDSTSTDYNNQNTTEQQSQDQAPPIEPVTPTDPAAPAPEQPPVDQPAPEPVTPESPTQPSPEATPEEPVQDGNNAIPQGQSREGQEPTQDQTDQATDPTMERPAEITPVEDKTGPNGEAIFRENGKFYYMNEAGEKTKIKKSELKDKQ